MMKKTYKHLFLGFTMIIPALLFIGCSDNKEEPKDTLKVTIGFEKASSNLFASSAYGENLYNGEISTGYIRQIYGDKYAQFPINYGLNYNQNFELSWCYTYFNGGFALSKYHNMENASYLNQLSVYDSTSPSGGNFIVANGSSMVTDPKQAKYKDYEGCAKVYITDKTGYSIASLGQAEQISGKEENAWFKSVWINNTTYTYLTMRDGNDYSVSLNEDNKGWFKVQFIAFDDDDSDELPIGFTEVYLANFNKDLADGYIGIIDEWIEVDLSILPECSILVINFVGSDSGEWGLNTPAYCALDNFIIEVEK